LKYPEAYCALGLRLPRGVLLHGPPGCAKTSLVRAAAACCHVSFMAVSGAQLYSSYLGESEKKIAEVHCTDTITYNNYRIWDTWNVREFVSCHGKIRGFTLSQRNVRKEILTGKSCPTLYVIAPLKNNTGTDMI